MIALAKAGFARWSQSAGGFGLRNFAMIALAKAGFARWSQSAEGFGLRNFANDRVGVGGLCPLEPERGRVWEPFEGSHYS
jgi:hypothetical protein